MRRRSPPRGPVPARRYLLVGEPGIGKTTLLRGLVEQAGEMTVLETAGVESEADLPYAALIDVLQPVLHRLDALPEAQAVALSTALALGPPGVVDRFAVGVATLGLLARSGRGRPGADRRRRSAMGRFGVPRRALVRGTASHGNPRASSLPLNEPARRLCPALQVVPVGPLDREDATRVLAENEGRIAPEVLTRILDAAHGNPLALVELPHLLTPGQLAGTEVLANPIPTANGLERAFAARLAPLSAGGRLATVVAAADSSGTAGVVLGAFGSLGIAERDLGEVESLGLLQIEPNRLEFRHPLVRSAAYHGADPAERRRVHAALADADSDPDRRAWHRAAATVGLDDVIADELDRAGVRALARGAFGAGAAALERAASLTEARDARGAGLLRAANAMDAAGNLVRSQALAHEAADLIDDPRLHAELVILLGRLRMAGGEVEAGHSMLLEEAERISELDPALAARTAQLRGEPAGVPTRGLCGRRADRARVDARRFHAAHGCRPSATPTRSPRRWPATSPARPCSSSLRWRPGRTWRPGTRWAPRSGGRSSGWRSTPSPAPCSPGQSGYSGRAARCGTCRSR